MKKRTAGSRRRRVRDPDAVSFRSVNWANLKPVQIELDPILVESIRARQALKQLTLRVGVEQIAEARREASRTGRKYQAVLRQWLAEGASSARTARLKSSGRNAGGR
jgi:hypothetical protein